MGVFALQGNQLILADRSRSRLIRITENGTLDPGFHSPPAGVVSAIENIAIDSMGRVILVTSDPANDSGERLGLPRQVLRLQRDGDPDSSFKSAAIDGISNGMAVDNLDRIIVAGDFSRANAEPRASIVRLLSSGGIDPTFLIKGAESAVYSGVFKAQDQSFYLIRSQEDHSTLARLSPDGAVDASYQAPELPSGASFFPQPDGAFLVVRYLERLALIERLRPDGSLDTSFIPQSIVGAFSPTSEPNGSLLFTTVGSVNGQPSSRLVRILPNAPPNRIELSESSGLVFETNGLVSLMLTRTGDRREPLTIEWQTSGGTAMAGIDYLPTNGVVMFGSGAAETQIQIRLAQERGLNSDKTLGFQFRTATGTDLPPVALTIANADLGFAPGTATSVQGNFVAWFSGAPGEVIVERSQNLRDWEPYQTGYAGDLNQPFQDWSEPAPAMFYRLVRIP